VALLRRWTRIFLLPGIPARPRAGPMELGINGLEILRFSSFLATCGIEGPFHQEKMMSGSLEDIAETKQPRVEAPEIDGQIASILAAIEREMVPDRLLALAGELQAALTRKRRRDRG
jgi:hypothetical protein